MTGPTWTVGDDVGWVSDETTEAVYVALLPWLPHSCSMAPHASSGSLRWRATPSPTS